MGIINAEKLHKRCGGGHSPNHRRGFTLIELILVILVMAVLISVAVAGGAAVIKKAKITRAKNELRNFAIAAETTLNENPQVSNIAATTNKGRLEELMEAMNGNLAADYRLSPEDGTLTGNIKKLAVTNDDSDHIVCVSEKTDPWDNPYYVVIDRAERGGSSDSQFYMTAISAGPNAITTLDGTIDSDDLFALFSYVNGDVTSKVYDMKTSAPTVMDGSTPATDYVSVMAAPVNNGKTTEFGAVAAVSFDVYLSSFQEASDPYHFHGSFSSSVDENVLSVNMDGYLDEDVYGYVGSIAPISALSFPFSVTVSGYDNDGQNTESIFFLDADHNPVHSNNCRDNNETYNITLGDIPSGAVYIGFGSVAYSTNSEWDYSGTTTFTFAS